MSLYLSRSQYVAALRRMREYLNTVSQIDGYDDTTIGAKNTECDAGLCLDAAWLWPRDANLFPDQYPQRVSPKYRSDALYCPVKETQRYGLLLRLPPLPRWFA